MVPAIIGGAIALGSAFLKNRLAKKQAKLANAIKPVDPSYEQNAKANEAVAGARMEVNARMAGAGQMGRNIKQAQANNNAVVQRNATSGAQALALSAASEGQAMQSAANLQTAEEQNTQVRKQRFNGMLISQGDKEFNDKVRKFRQDQDAKDRLMGSSIQNQGGILDDLGSAGASIAGSYLGEAAYTKELQKRIKLLKTAPPTPNNYKSVANY